MNPNLMTIRPKSLSFLWMVLAAAVMTACGPLPPALEYTPGTTSLPTAISIIEPATATVVLPATHPPQALAPVGRIGCQFTSSEDQISGWYWLRDEAYHAYGKWVCSGLPGGIDVPVILLALVTDPNGGVAGYGTPVRIIYSLPSGDKSQAVQVYLQNSLALQETSDSRSVNNQATGYLVIPASYIDSSGAVEVRLERFSPSPDHVAVNAEGLNFVSPSTPASSVLMEGDLVSGWRWLKDPSHQSAVEWKFRGLDRDAPVSIITLDALVTQGVDGGSGYNMPVKVTLTNPSSGESTAFEQAQLTNLLFIQDPENSGGRGYQVYGSLQFDSRLIDERGGLFVRLERPLSTEYHLAVSQNTPGVVQLGGLDYPVDDLAQDLPTSENPQDKANCEAQGGRWGKVGLSPRELCNLPTTDAGKECYDSSECESACIAELTQEQFDEVWRGGALLEISGACAEWQIVVGCLPFVEDGMVQVICVD